jgi:hypothetical protein
MGPHRLTTFASFQLLLPADSTLASLSSVKANALRTDLGTVDRRIRSGVTNKRANAMDKHWERWEKLCLENNVDPLLQTWDDPVPIIQVFGERYRDGRLAPKQNSVKSRTVEDAVRAVGQAHVRLGAPDPRKDHHGKIDFRIQRQMKAYEKTDDPPRRVKPVPMLVIVYILEQAYGGTRSLAETAIAGMICIAVFFLLRPGEYTGTTADDTPFRLEDVGVYIRDRNLDISCCSDVELDSATSVSYTFTTQKNGTRDEKLVQGRSGNALCCPVRATIRRVKHHRLKKSSPHTPIASYYATSRRTAVKPKDVTDTLGNAMRINFNRTGITATDISARYLRAAGAMAIFAGNIDTNNIRLMGRWHSDAMMRYLHGQAQPIVGNFAARMFNDGAFTFQPDETVPIIDNYGD